MKNSPDSGVWFDIPGLSEAEIARLIVAFNRVEEQRERFRCRAQGLTEPRAVRALRLADGFDDAYHEAEHRKRLDIILRDISLR